MCDHPEATIEDALDNVRTIIRKHGWAVKYVENARAPWAYTIGLHVIGLPELLVTGLEPALAGSFLNHVAGVVMCGTPFAAGTRTTLEDGLLVETVEVEHPDAHMDFAIAIEGPQVTARQLVWADAHGRMPWDRRFDGGRSAQPVLGRRATPRSG
ncbi:MAG TPA: DUF4262 domain-containing protein [Aldersonia sp.]